MDTSHGPSYPPSERQLQEIRRLEKTLGLAHLKVKTRREASDYLDELRLLAGTSHRIRETDRERVTERWAQARKMAGLN